jgi:hypothetical protein
VEPPCSAPSCKGAEEALRAKRGPKKHWEMRTCGSLRREVDAKQAPGARSTLVAVTWVTAGMLAGLTFDVVGVDPSRAVSTSQNCRYGVGSAYDDLAIATAASHCPQPRGYGAALWDDDHILLNRHARTTPHRSRFPRYSLIRVGRIPLRAKSMAEVCKSNSRLVGQHSAPLTPTTATPRSSPVEGDLRLAGRGRRLELQRNDL